MSGLPSDNAEAFIEATHTLRALGYSVCSPTETDRILGILTHENYLRFDFERILEADFLVALDGWEESDGALAEIHMALRMGLKVWRWSEWGNYDQVTLQDLNMALKGMQW